MSYVPGKFGTLGFLTGAQSFRPGQFHNMVSVVVTQEQVDLCPAPRAPPPGHQHARSAAGHLLGHRRGQVGAGYIEGSFDQGVP